MKKAKEQSRGLTQVLSLGMVLLLALMVGCATSGSKTAEKKSSTEAGEVAMHQPMEIPENVSCGKCGMYPAKYPQWQSQIIFKDGTMTPFDGCKCMFNFAFGMEQFDKTHSRDDVAVMWVKDFNSGSWLNATDAFFVVGSSMMGPMGKELIPFADQAAAMKFHGEQGGTVMKYGDVNPEVMKTLGMGGMKKHMKM